MTIVHIASSLSPDLHFFIELCATAVLTNLFHDDESLRETSWLALVAMLGCLLKWHDTEVLVAYYSEYNLSTANVFLNREILM